MANIVDKTEMLFMPRRNGKMFAVSVSKICILLICFQRKRREKGRHQEKSERSHFGESQALL